MLKKERKPQSALSKRIKQTTKVRKNCGCGKKRREIKSRQTS